MRSWVLNYKTLTFMVVFVIHDPGDLMAFELGMLVSMLCLFDIFDFLACFLGLADSLFSFGCVFDWASEDGISLFIH